VVLAGAAAPNRADAQISFVNLFRNLPYVQTGNGSALTPLGAFFSSGVNSVNPGDYNTGTMTYPGPGSPVSLNVASSTTLAFQTGLYPSQAAMDSDFPTGTYQFDVSGALPPSTASLSYTADFYPQSLPFLTGNNFSDLQGMNSAAPFTFLFSPFVTGAGVNSSFIFLTIFDLTTSTFVFDAGFLPAITTSFVLPANMLMPGHDYSYELDYSNRVLVPSPGAVFDGQLGFDVRTTGRFSTSAVPEPAVAVTTLGIAVVSASLIRRRRV
jgi:hypothetical protein